MIRWLGLLFPIALAAQAPDRGGIVAEPARSYLAQRYNAATEQGYCVTAWHWSGRSDTVVVDSVTIAYVELAERYAVSFACPRWAPTIHTHPADRPHVSATDQVTGLIHLGLPWIAVQSGPDVFEFWIPRRRRQ